MIFLDTNVLAYATGREHPLRAPCRLLTAAIDEGRVIATTTPETIQEFAHIRARRGGRPRAALLARTYATALGPLRVSEPDHLETGLRLWEMLPQLDAFDAVLAAVALDSKHRTLVSADRAFADVPGLHHVYPDDKGVASLLGRD